MKILNKLKVKAFILTLFLALHLPSLLGQTLPKVVSLTPNTTEIIILLGGTKSLAGRSSACSYIPQVKNIPIVGNMGRPSLESIVALKPTAVIASLLMNQSDVQVMKSLGIKCYLLPIETFTQYYQAVKIIGQVLCREKEADAEILRVQTGIEKFKNQYAFIDILKRPKVFWELWNKPLITIGNSSFLNEFIELAGGKSITSCINRNYIEISDESVFTSNPDAIFAPGFPNDYAGEFKNQIGWKSLSAVKNNRVYTQIDPNLVNVFGPKMLETIQIIHNLLYNNK